MALDDLTLQDLIRIREQNPDRWEDVKRRLRQNDPKRWERIQEKLRAAAKPSGDPAEPTPAPVDDGWGADNQNAYDLLLSTFQSYGLGSLAPKILEMLQTGLGNDSIALQLQQTEEYKQRFAGNEIRKNAGLPVLSPPEYINQENAYRQALSYYGLPAGFYDDPSDFADWIGKDVSAAEIKDRAAIAAEMTAMAPTEVKQALAAYYGIGEGEIAAYFLDQKRALPIVERMARAAQIGGAATANQLSVSAGRADELAQYGISQDEARQGYAAIGQNLDALRDLAAIDKTSFSQDDAEDAYLKKQKTGLDKVRRLASNERARFGGGSGVNQASLSQRRKGSY